MQGIFFSRGNIDIRDFFQQRKYKHFEATMFKNLGVKWNEIVFNPFMHNVVKWFWKELWREMVLKLTLKRFFHWSSHRLRAWKSSNPKYVANFLYLKMPKLIASLFLTNSTYQCLSLHKLFFGDTIFSCCNEAT